MTFYSSLFILIFSVIGFGVSLYFYIQAKDKESLNCPGDPQCDMVVHSQYSRFFGIPVQILGLGFYGLTAFGSSMLLIEQDFHFPIVAFLFIVITFTAFLFSIYLSLVQLVALKHTCAWCLLSSVLTIAIFILAFIGLTFPLDELLVEHRLFFVFMHLVGVALGVGGATTSDIFFFKFLNNLRISPTQHDMLDTFSQIVWFALAIFVVSGAGLYYPNQADLNESAKFLVKMIAVGVVILNGFFLNIIVAPALSRMSFDKEVDHFEKKLNLYRNFAFAMGAISLISWYTALILGVMDESPLPFLPLLGIYLGVLIAGIIGSQIFFHFLLPRKISAAQKKGGPGFRSKGSIA